MTKRKLYGGIEAGGTKFVCGIGSGNGELLHRLEIPTTSPTETLDAVNQFFKLHPDICAMGVGSFGPIEINKQSESFGAILETPKPGWSGVNIYQKIRGATNIPVVLVTDTDAAAIGEQYHGIGLHVKNFVYLTIGTGIGGSIITNGSLQHGASHPEMGHMRIPSYMPTKHIGACPYHSDCLESVASGKSLELSYGKPADEITDAAAWDIEARHIALALMNIVLISQPERIIIGGGVAKHEGLLLAVKSYLQEYVNGYITLPDMHTYIVQASSDSIGVLGAIKLASIST